MRIAGRILKYVFLALAVIAGAVILFVLVSVVPVDRTPYRERASYLQMQDNLAKLDEVTIPSPAQALRVGCALENITPDYPATMVGSGPAKVRFTSVHDSIYVRTMVVGNGARTVALVTADMLIIPPTITRVLKEKLPAVGFSLDNVYLSATHTHSSIGNWGENLAGEFYSGPYDDALVQFIADKIVQSIKVATRDQQRALLRYATIPAGKTLFNRLADEKGGIDSLLRVVEVHREDSSRLILASYTGHATCMRSGNEALSRDYPGVLVDQLEANGYDFAMFMAGAVGSHGCGKGVASGWPRVKFVGEYLATKILSHAHDFTAVEDSTVAMFRVPLALDDPHVRLTKDWRTRSWLFSTFFGEYPAYITTLRLGNIVMLGTPCDFSGELMPPIDSTATHHGLHAMVTSFNGGYIGYITLDKHYDIDHYETRIMNWYGPGNGAYLTESLIRMLETADQ